MQLCERMGSWSHDQREDSDPFSHSMYFERIWADRKYLFRFPCNKAPMLFDRRIDV